MAEPTDQTSFLTSCSSTSLTINTYETKVNTNIASYATRQCKANFKIGAIKIFFKSILPLLWL